MRRYHCTLVSFLLGLVALPAAAQPVPAAPTVAAPAEAPRLQLGVLAGVNFSQVSSELGTSFGVELEGGYRVWRHLCVFLGLGYSQPSVDSSRSDPQLGATAYSTTTTQRELRLSVGAMWRLRDPGAALNGFAGIGARAYFLETVTNGSAGGQSFLENQETSTRFGGLLVLGVELRLGPGVLVGALDVSGSPLPHLVTGHVQTTALGLNVGYRVFFGGARGQ
jgi:hypothetical protein